MSDVPEADALEQAEPPDREERPDLPPDAPEADALDQATPAEREAPRTRPRIPDDVPEADALEQAETLPDPEEEH